MRSTWLGPIFGAAALVLLAGDTPAAAQTHEPARAGIARAARDVAALAATTASRPPDSTAFTVVTFNAGLAPGAVALSTERSPRVMEALREEPFDVLCAQEVWLEDDFAALRAALADRAPHVLRTPRASPPTGSCGPSEVALLEACHRASCATDPGLAECMVARCAHLALSLPSDCVACLTREPWKALGDARRACAAPGAALLPRASPPVSPARDGRAPRSRTGAGGPLAFGGSDGVVLASRIPFSTTATLRLPSAYSQRVVHHARFEASPIGPLDVFCTHLSAQLGSVPYPGRGTWDDEHVTHVGALVDWIDERTRGVAGTTIVAGDLNMGPNLPGRVEPRRAPQFARLIARGFVAPYVSSPDARCTFCKDNPLTGGAVGRPGGTLLDHVLLRGFGGDVETRRVLVTSRSSPPTPTVLSDHYGLAAKLRARASSVR